MKFYPIGTVVVLKEGTWPLMIYARQQMPKRSSDTTYDYVGCLYPQGYIDKVLYPGMKSVAEEEMERLLHIPEGA